MNNDNSEDNTKYNDIISTIYTYMEKYELKWSKFLNIKNPYDNPDNILFNKDVPIFDKSAAEKKCAVITDTSGG